MVYERKCPFKLCLRDSELIPKLGRDTIDEDEELIVKLLVKGPDDRPEMVRVELFSTNDYFFMYYHEADSAVYQEMKKSQPAED
jgi:hypothetical protein